MVCVLTVVLFNLVNTDSVQMRLCKSKIMTSNISEVNLNETLVPLYMVYATLIVSTLPLLIYLRPLECVNRKLWNITLQLFEVLQLFRILVLS